MYIGGASLIKQLCLNKGSTSRANMGTSVIYFCRLLLMAYFEGDADKEENGAS